MSAKTWRVAGINFEHMHMGMILGFAHAHPQVEIVGICHDDRDKMAGSIESFGIPEDRVYTDMETCLEESKPDIVILCPMTARHAEYTERVAAHGEGYHIIIDKPFADSVEGADRMTAAVEKTGKHLAINWPLAWYPPHMTTRRLIEEGVIGDPIEVHYYDGNKANGLVGEFAWFLEKDKGGGSLMDYMGYGTTLATWFLHGRAPLEVMTQIYVPDGWEVDSHSISILRYETGLSKMETRFGTFTSPWLNQPQPKCGFVVVGTKGTIASYDYEDTIAIQTEEKTEIYQIPVDDIQPPYQNCMQYLIHCLENDIALTGPITPAISRIGQQIVDAALQSIELGQPVKL